MDKIRPESGPLFSIIHLISIGWYFYTALCLCVKFIDKSFCIYFIDVQINPVGCGQGHETVDWLSLAAFKAAGELNAPRQRRQIPRLARLDRRRLGGATGRRFFSTMPAALPKPRWVRLPLVQSKGGTSRQWRRCAPLDELAVLLVVGDGMGTRPDHAHAAMQRTGSSPMPLVVILMRPLYRRRCARVCLQQPR